MMISSLISGKFNEIKDLNILNSKYAIIYKRTKENERIQDVVQQYLGKYERILNWQG